MTEKRPGRKNTIRWFNNMGSHLEENNISLKEGMRTELVHEPFKSRKLISYHTDFLTTIGVLLSL